MSAFILESPIFQEAKILKSDPGKAIFRMVMQTVDEENQNRRIYPSAVMQEAMRDVEPRMTRRAFFGELDHPTPAGNEQFDGVRQTTVMLKDASHIIRNYDFKGNHLMGEIETSSTPNGAILLGHLKDKAGVGLSMRGMAELEKQENRNIVKSPLMVVAYDAVSLPSHSAAVVDFNEMKFESLNVLTENSRCGTVCTPDGKCFLVDYFDKLVETKVIQFFDRWV